MRLLKNIFFLLIFTFSNSKKSFSLPTDPIKEFYIVIEGHGLMCPFLSPLFTQKLSEWHPLSLYRIENEYAIVVQLAGNDLHTEDDIISILVNIGYESSKIQITESFK